MRSRARAARACRCRHAGLEARPRRRRTFPNRADHAGGAAGAGRLERHPRAARRPEARTQVRQAGDHREPPRRRRHHRRARRRARRSRRLHDDHGVEHHDVAQCHDPEADAVRSAQGSHADRDDRAHAVRARRQSRAAGSFGRRPGQARAREERAVIVRHAGAGDVSSAERGDPAHHVRSRVHPRPL